MNWVKNCSGVDSPPDKIEMLSEKKEDKELLTR